MLNQMEYINSISNFHDFEIFSICVDRGKQIVEIGLAESSLDVKRKIILCGVKKIYMTNLLIQNVILDVQIFKKEENSEYYRFCKKYLELDNDFFEIHPKLSVLYIEPSVGAELACIFEQLNIE